MVIGAHLKPACCCMGDARRVSVLREMQTDIASLVGAQALHDFAFSDLEKEVEAPSVKEDKQPPQVPSQYENSGQSCSLLVVAV